MIYSHSQDGRDSFVTHGLMLSVWEWKSFDQTLQFFIKINTDKTDFDKSSIRVRKVKKNKHI